MRSVFAIVALPLLLLFILDGSLPPLLPAISVKAFPAAVTSSLANTATYNKNATIPSSNQATDTAVVMTAGEVTEYPVFISVTEETQPSPETVESEVVTETYMIIEDQEVDDDEDGNNSDASDSSTRNPSNIVRSTTPMQSPKSSPEQEEVLRELKKLWDLSEGMSDTENDALKTSLSSIVHLAYARVYIEPDETLLKLKYLLQQLHDRILLGTNSNLDVTTTQKALSSTSHAKTTDSTSTPAMTVTTAGVESNKTKGEPKTREKRSFYDGYDDEVEAIFFANVNSVENSVIPEEKDHYQIQEHLTEPMKVKSDLNGNNNVIHITQLKNDSISTKTEDDKDRTLLPVGTISSSSVISMSTTAPTSVVQKIVHINDRQKPMPSFYLTPERIKELKSRVTSSTTTTSTLSPISIVIEDELENEVNLLQQQQHVDNYDIHISSAETLVPLTTVTPPTSSFHKKPSSGESTTVISPSSTTTTESPFTAEDIALALFHLLRPGTFEDDESDIEHVTTHPPHPTPSNILYQVGSLSSVLNFTINPKNATTTSTTAQPINVTMTTVPTSSTIASAKFNTTLSFLKLKEKYTIKNKKNATLLVPLPPALSDLEFITTTTRSSTSTERQHNPQNDNDIYDYTDVLDQKPAADQTSITATIVQDTQQGVQQMVNALTRLSVGAKMVLLFSVSISILSIGIGLYALGPPIAGVGILGIIIPIGLLLLFETSSSGGKRKLTMRQQEQHLISKLQSEEFSKIMDMIFDAVIKYNKG